MTELAALQEELGELKEILGQDDDFLFLLAGCFGLTRYEASVVGMLLKREGTTYQSIHAVLYGRRPLRSQPEMNAVHTLLTRLRKKLAALDIDLIAVRGLGCRLSPKDKQKLRHLLQQEAA
jgi:hypothetical protein